MLVLTMEAPTFFKIIMWWVIQVLQGHKTLIGPYMSKDAAKNRKAATTGGELHLFSSERKDAKEVLDDFDYEQLQKA